MHALDFYKMFMLHELIKYVAKMCVYCYQLNAMLIDAVKYLDSSSN